MNTATYKCHTCKAQWICTDELETAIDTCPDCGGWLIEVSSVRYQWVSTEEGSIDEMLAL